MVPRETGVLFGDGTKKQALCCGKQRHVIYKQLVELVKRDSVVVDVSGGCGGGGGVPVVRMSGTVEAEDLVPQAPPRNEDRRVIPVVCDSQQPLRQEAPVARPSSLHHTSCNKHSVQVKS